MCVVIYCNFLHRIRNSNNLICSLWLPRWSRLNFIPRRCSLPLLLIIYLTWREGTVVYTCLYLEELERGVNKCRKGWGIIYSTAQVIVASLLFHSSYVWMHIIFSSRSPSSSVVSASFCSATAAGVCSSVAGDRAERHHGLWAAGGVCHHRVGNSPVSNELQREGPTAPGTKSTGEWGWQEGKM